MRGLSLFGFVAVLLVIPSCAPSETSEARDATASVMDAEASEAALRAAFDGMIAAFENEDIEAIDSFYGDEIVIIPPGEAVITDRAAQMEGLSALAQSDYTIEAEIRDLDLSGDLAVTFVAYSDTMTPNDGTEAESSTGRWAIVWKRGADGQWRIAREIWNLAPEDPSGS